MRLGPHRRDEKAFALRELVVVLSVLGGLILLHLPSQANSKAISRGFGCLSNQRQLVLAWLMYAEDHGGSVPFAYQSGGSLGWIGGWLDFLGNNPVNTNTQFLLDPKYASMGPYARKAEIYRCPEDPSQVRIAGTVYPRVRSYSMNGAFSETLGGWLPAPPYKVFRNVAEIVAPPPYKQFVFIDEHPDSINDGMLAIQMADPANPARIFIIDYPASYHNGGAGLSFADGHADFHRWTDPRTKPAFRNQLIPLNIASPGNQDMVWLSERTSARAQ